MWHVSSRGGVATLRTAIHLLLTYFVVDTGARRAESKRRGDGPDRLLRQLVETDRGLRRQRVRVRARGRVLLRPRCRADPIGPRSRHAAHRSADHRTRSGRRVTTKLQLLARHAAVNLLLHNLL